MFLDKQIIFFLCKLLSDPDQKITVQQLLRDHFQAYLRSKDRKLILMDYHLEAVHKIMACQTARLGIYHFVCEGCGLMHSLPRSCKHRFCSNCGVADTHRWAEKMLGRLLDIKHHHVVATLPKGLRHIAQLNGNKLHNLLFESSSYVLKDWFEHKHEMKCGIVSVLHTNGSDLKYHPHVHMIVSGGGIVGDKLELLSGNYISNQQYLGRQFKRVFVTRLLNLYDKGELKVPSRIRNRIDLLKQVKDISVGCKHWVIHVEKSLEGVAKLIRYVGRYTKRSCISERRIKSVKDGEIVYEHKDYKRSKEVNQLVYKTLSLPIEAFLDRLLQHIPAPGYKVVRYYGIYATSNLSKLPDEYLCQVEARTYELRLEEGDVNFREYREAVYRKTGQDPLRCEHCDGQLRIWCLEYEQDGVRRIEYVNTAYEDSG